MYETFMSRFDDYKKRSFIENARPPNEEETSSKHESIRNLCDNDLKNDYHAIYSVRDLGEKNCPKEDVYYERLDVYKDDFDNDLGDLIQSHISSSEEIIPCEYNGDEDHGASFQPKTYASTEFSKLSPSFSNFNLSCSDTNTVLHKNSSVKSGVVTNLPKTQDLIKPKSAYQDYVYPNRSKHTPTQNVHLPNDKGNSTQVKTKLRSLWNNMKYGWRMKREVSLKLDSTTWLLGRLYHNQLNDSLYHDAGKEFKLDFLSKIWLSYRINFPAISGSGLISDTGWGCMLRCGQMMMAQALVCHFLSRDWRIPVNQSDDKYTLYKMILRFFGDSTSSNSPFSLHQLVLLGERYGRKAGDWYGPTHASQVLRDALHQSKENHVLLKNLCMYVALDGIVFKQDVNDICMDKTSSENKTSSDETNKIHQECSEKCQDSKTKITRNEDLLSSNMKQKETDEYSKECSEAYNKNSDECPSYSQFGPPSFNSFLQPHWRSLILFVSVRLGNDKINSFYIPCLKNLLSYENCIGIIGGRPKHALFFIGWQDDKLIHMDPHSCQPAIDVEKEDFNEKSFHSSSVRTISFTEMDPSCAIGFYFKHQNEYENFIEHFSEITSPMRQNLDYPVFALAEGKRIDIENINFKLPCSKPIVHTELLSYNDEDDFILL